MKLLSDLHFKNNAVMGIYNHQCVPSSYHDIYEEYKAVRENVLLVDYSHQCDGGGCMGACKLFGIC